MKKSFRHEIGIWIGLPVLCLAGSFATVIVLGTLAKKVGLL